MGDGYPGPEPPVGDNGITDQMRQMVQGVVNEINSFRRDPNRYAEDMTRLRNCYDGNVLTYPESGIQLETVEGREALEDCLQDLMNASPLPVLMHSQAIGRACQKHLSDLQDNDFCSHIGTDGSTPEERLSKFGEHREQCGENIVFSMQTPKEVVWHMLIDHGSPDRGHRANLLNMDFHFLGAAFGRHPSAETVAIVLLVDHFKPRKLGAFHRMQHAAQVVASETQAAKGPAKQASEDVLGRWNKLLLDIRPDYLSVPLHLRDQIDRLSKPLRHKWKYNKTFAVPRFTIGMLDPKPNVDPAVIRGFVHRVDKDFDDLVEESEIQQICHRHMLGISPEHVTQMFEEILERRPPQSRIRRAIDWMEIFAATKIRKKWVPVVDIHIESERDMYDLTIEVEQLEQWCEELYSELQEHVPNLNDPAAVLRGSITDQNAMKTASRNRQGAERMKKLNKFLDNVMDTTTINELTVMPLQNEIKVQQFFRKPGDEVEVLTVNPRTFNVVVCMNRRRLWSYAVRPFREFWLRLFRASGLDPIVPMPAMPEEQPIEAHIDKELSQQRKANVARPDRVEYSGLPPGLETMKSRAEREKVEVRSLRPADLYPATEKIGLLEDGVQSNVKPWEERRQQTEGLVNQNLQSDAAATQGNTKAEMSYTFDARRMFLQSLSKQQRASDEQRFLAAEKRLEQSGSTMMEPSARGAGAFPLSHGSGLLGHFHSSATIQEGARWPPKQAANWDGSHIDHTKIPAQKEDPKYSKMTEKERAKQFSCYFGKDASHQRDSQAIKKEAVEGTRSNNGPFKSWAPPEFRADNPARHGKFGRRIFDPTVKDKPLSNVGNVSELESKPMEEFFWQQERVHDFLDRSLPPGQTKHFKTSLPTCENCHKHEEMANRQPIRFVMDGDRKASALGFGQNRHSDRSLDMQLYSRPLGASHMDRAIDLAPRGR